MAGVAFKMESSTLCLLRISLNVFRNHRFLHHACQPKVFPLTSQEVATALRPFYFIVHPDMFWNHPKEKETNENSLKQLNSYLESLLRNQGANSVTVNFFLRDVKSSKSDPRQLPFKNVNIKLKSSDLHKTVHSVLSACELPTEYLDRLAPAANIPRSPPRQESWRPPEKEKDFVWGWDDDIPRAEQQVQNEPEPMLKTWFSDNVDEAVSRLKSSVPLRDEVIRLSQEIKDTWNLKAVMWDCGWGVNQYRGCLLSFKTMAVQHPDDMLNLLNKTVVFGTRTGVSLDGHIILSSEDVRNNWLDLIRSISVYNKFVSDVPEAERSLSEVLRGIVVDHRKFKPAVMVQNYCNQLRKLTVALYRYKWDRGLPSFWPSRLDDYQLVVECEAGPLMLSPTGQFIAPASCPPHLLVSFISDNMDQACQRKLQYKQEKERELELYNQCMWKLGLEALTKDDNITPDLMINCCERLLENSEGLWSYLRDCRLRISHYYSVTMDGEICIPWDWKEK